MINYLYNILFLCSDKFMLGGVADSTSSGEMPSFGLMIFKLIISLIIIVVILYFSIKLFQKYSSQGKFINKGDSNIIDIMPLTNSQAIYVIKMYDLIYIIAVSGDNINLLEKIENRERINKILESKQNNLDNTFNNIFRKFRKK